MSPDRSPRRQLIVENGVGYDDWADKIIVGLAQAQSQGDRCPEAAGAAG